MKNVEQTESHLLLCDFYWEKENISYLPECGELYNEEITEHIYVYRILEYERRVSKDWYIGSTCDVWHMTGGKHCVKNEGS